MKQDKHDILSKYLTKLEKKHGRLTPSIVVEAARPETSPIHSYFQWDDAKAADGYRLWQARKLIAKVYIVVDPEEEKETPVKVRVFHSIVNDDEEYEEDRQYLNVYKIMSDDQLKQKLLADAMRDMNFFTEKYSSLEELAPVIAAMKGIVKKKK